MFPQPIRDTVVCIATGPSLRQADVEHCRGKATVVVVNDAHLVAPWADVLYSSDRYWWTHYRGLPRFTGTRASIEHTPGRHCADYSRWGVTVFRNTGDDGLETDPSGLRTCAANSGGAALNLAAHFRPAKIVLLGYDCGMPGSKRHFFGDHPSPLSNQQNFPTWRKAFATMRAPLDALGIRVLNCSRSTSLDAFPCVLLEEAI